MGSTCTNGIQNRDKKCKGILGVGKENKMLLKNSKQLCNLSLVLWMFLSLISHTEANFCVSKGYFFCCVFYIAAALPLRLRYMYSSSQYLFMTFSNCYLFFYEQGNRQTKMGKILRRHENRKKRTIGCKEICLVNASSTASRNKPNKS